VSYHEAVILPGPTGRHRSISVPLNSSRTLVVEEQPAGGPIKLTTEQAAAFFAWRADPAGAVLPEALTELRRWEEVADGLQDYF
jgi:hypothetical protein